MSQDYHDYEQLCARHRLLAFLWLVGDRVYYVGFLGGIMVAIGAPIAAIASQLRGAQIGPPLWNPFGLGLFVGCVLLALIGPTLKDFARRTGGIE
jgi:hypothetical protein